ncbi:MAG: hypothetical protein WA821_02445, partial [Anaerolineales bacterium]
MSSQFSAAPSNLGYLYQTLYALLLLLKSKEEMVLSIETLDDVVFEKDGNSREQLQLKHHIGQTANLTDISPDLWKTIRVWSTQLKNGTFSVNDTVLSLVTTAQAPDGSIGAMLKPGSKIRNIVEISQQLAKIAETSKSKNLEEAFAAYLALSPKQRENL